MENGKSEPSKKKNIRFGVPASILRIGTWVVSKFMIDDFFWTALSDPQYAFGGCTPYFFWIHFGYNSWRTIFICKSPCL
jgi:hypothetical protein